MKRSRGTTHFTSDEILRIVDDIRDSMTQGTVAGGENARRQHFEKKYPEFADRHRHLFDMVCENEFDRDRLKYMLEMRDSIEKKDISFENASKQIGQKMFDVYVKPKINGGAGTDV